MLKRIFLGLIIGILIFSQTALAGEVNVKIDGKDMYFPNQQPITIDEVTYVPLRVFFENAGYQVNWNQATQTADISNNENHFTITVGQSTIIYNGESRKAPNPAKIVNGTLMMPLKTIVSNAGGILKWNVKTKTADVKLLSKEELVAFKKYDDDIYEINVTIGSYYFENDTSVYSIINPKDYNNIRDINIIYKYIVTKNTQQLKDNIKAKLKEIDTNYEFISNLSSYKENLYLYEDLASDITVPDFYKEEHEQYMLLNKLTSDFITTYENYYINKTLTYDETVDELVKLYISFADNYDEDIFYTNTTIYYAIK